MSETTEPPQARSRPPRWMPIVTVVAALVGLAFLVFGVVGFTGASAADDEAADLAAETTTLEAQLDDLVQQQTALDEQSDEYDTRADAVSAAIDSQISTGNAVTDALGAVHEVFRQAADKGNNGDTAGERALFENEAAPLIADAQTALDDQRQVNEEFPPLVSALGELFR